MSAHTPGPWHTSPLYYSDIPENGRVVICAAPKSSQHAHTKVGEAAFSLDPSDYHVDRRTEAEANARLMAAAPMLLKAALHCEDMLMRYTIDRIDGEEIADAALLVIRAAIAEATGEQP